MTTLTLPQLFEAQQQFVDKSGFDRSYQLTINTLINNAVKEAIDAKEDEYYYHLELDKYEHRLKMEDDIEAGFYCDYPMNSDFSKFWPADHGYEPEYKEDLLCLLETEGVDRLLSVYIDATNGIDTVWCDCTGEPMSAIEEQEWILETAMSFLQQDILNIKG